MEDILKNQQERFKEIERLKKVYEQDKKQKDQEVIDSNLQKE